MPLSELKRVSVSEMGSVPRDDQEAVRKVATTPAKAAIIRWRAAKVKVTAMNRIAKLTLHSGAPTARFEDMMAGLGSGQVGNSG